MFQWFDSTGISVSTSDSLILSNLQIDSTSNYHVEVTSSGITDASDFSTLVVYNVVNQPADTTAVVGEDAIFSVDISVSDDIVIEAYMWFFGTDTLLTTGERIEDATTNQLTIRTVESADAGEYHVSIKLSGVSDTITIDAASLTVSMFAIINQPSSVQVQYGDNVVLTVSTNAPGDTFEWFYSNNLLSNGGTISGADTSTLRINSANLYTQAGEYRVEITRGTTTVSSNPATLTIVCKLYTHCIIYC